MFTKASLTLAALTISTAAFAMSDADANGDKLLTIDEMKATYPEISEDQFMQADANSDGVINAQELSDATQAGVLPNLGE